MVDAKKVVDAIAGRPLHVVAAELGISPLTLSQIARGTREPRQARVIAAVQALINRRAGNE